MRLPPQAFPGGSVVKNPPAIAGDAGSILGWRRSPREGNGNALQSSCLENPLSHEQRSLASYSLWGHKRVRHNLATNHHHPHSTQKDLLPNYWNL